MQAEGKLLEGAELSPRGPGFAGKMHSPLLVEQSSSPAPSLAPLMLY